MREESGFLNMSLGEVAVGDEFNLSKVKWWSRVKKVGSLVYLHSHYLQVRNSHFSPCVKIICVLMHFLRIFK